MADTNAFTASGDEMPFPHALIECYCVGNPKMTNPKFKSTIEMIAATVGDSADQRRKYADADLQKDSDWWKSVIGEMGDKLSEDFKRTNSTVEWIKIKGFRNIVAY